MRFFRRPAAPASLDGEEEPRGYVCELDATEGCDDTAFYPTARPARPYARCREHNLPMTVREVTP